MSLMKAEGQRRGGCQIMNTRIISLIGPKYEGRCREGVQERPGLREP